jgi:UDP-N-acetylmuramoyl-L-alanyl-D-glutamate--2,6-diaminopimelate ligase
MRTMAHGVPISSLLEDVSVLELRGDPATPISAVSYDSRDVLPGHLFVALEGVHVDGHRYVGDALARGAAAVLHSQPLEEPTARAAGSRVTCVRVADTRRSLSPVAAAFSGRPSRRLKVIGVTGTDGKSSTTWFIHQLLGFAGRRSGFLSTVSFQPGDEVVKNPFRQSTPEAPEVHGMLAEMAAGGREFAVVEATSHGLSERTNRLGDVLFDAGVLTNVTHEHLEFHGSFAQYRSDKANLFRRLGRPKDVSCPRFGVVNVEDPAADYFREAAPVPVHTYSTVRPADLFAADVRHDLSGTTFRLCAGDGSREARIGFPGPFWVDNALAAVLAVSRMLERDPLEFAPWVKRLTCITGRMEYVALGQPFAVVVDYAHTPGAFERLFPWVRSVGRGRIIAVFGSAGERDPGKRPMQGRVAARWCDIVVLTDEDPRGEDRTAILGEIAAGCEGKVRGTDLFLEPDRPAAIQLAFGLARPGDAVLLLGKGHEGSIIGPAGSAAWDERAEAERALRAMGYSA